VITAETAERLRHLASEAPGNAVTTLRTSIQLRDTIYDIFSAIAQRRVIPSTALAILNKAVRQAAQHALLVHATGGLPRNGSNRKATWTPCSGP